MWKGKLRECTIFESLRMALIHDDNSAGSDIFNNSSDSPMAGGVSRPLTNNTVYVKLGIV